MAGKDFALRATPAAVTMIERLRGTARRSYAAFETELRKQLAERRIGTRVSDTGSRAPKASRSIQG